MGFGLVRKGTFLFEQDLVGVLNETLADFIVGLQTDCHATVAVEDWQEQLRLHEVVTVLLRSERIQRFLEEVGQRLFSFRSYRAAYEEFYKRFSEFLLRSAHLFG